MLHIRRFQYPHGTASRLCATPIALISTIPLSIDLLRLGIRFAVLEMIYARFSRIILSTSNTGGAVALSQNLVQGCAAKLSKTARTTKSKNPLTLVVVFHCVRLPLPPMFAVSTEGREYKRFAVHWLAAITIIGRKEEETHSTRMRTCGNSDDGGIVFGSNPSANEEACLWFPRVIFQNRLYQNTSGRI